MAQERLFSEASISWQIDKPQRPEHEEASKAQEILPRTPQLQPLTRYTLAAIEFINNNEDNSYGTITHSLSATMAPQSNCTAACRAYLSYYI